MKALSLLFEINLDNKIGIVNSNMEFIIQAEYDSITLYGSTVNYQNYFILKNNDKYSLTDLQGNFIAENVDKLGLNTRGYNHIHILNNNLFSIHSGEFFSFNKNKFLPSVQFGEYRVIKDIVNFGEFSDDLCFVEFSDSTKGYINRDLEIVFRSNNINEYKFFHDGMSSFVNNGLIGFFDNKENCIIEPKFEISQKISYNFRDGKCCVQLNNKYGLINKSGEFIILPDYDFPIQYSDDVFSSEPEYRKKTGKFYNFNGKLRFEIKIGQKVGNLIVNDIEHDSCGIRCILKDEEYHNKRSLVEIQYLDSNGKILSSYSLFNPDKSGISYQFYDDLCFVQFGREENDSYYFVTDKFGKKIVSSKYYIHPITSFVTYRKYSNFIIVNNRDSDSSDLYNSNGIKISSSYNDYFYISENFIGIKVTETGNGVIDKNGQLIVKPYCENIQFLKDKTFIANAIHANIFPYPVFKIENDWVLLMVSS